MKMIHMADLHLGKTVNGMNLAEDQQFFLNQALELIHKEKPDVVVIAGDIYDRSVPPAWAVTLLDDFLTKAVLEKTKILMVGGNHDAGQRLDFGSRLLSKADLYMEGNPKPEIQCVTIKDAYGYVDIRLLPFVVPAQVKQWYPDAAIDTYEDAVKKLLEENPVDLSKRNVLVTHQFVTGSAGQERSDSERIPDVGGIDQISYEIFHEYDYVALGHLHGPQQAGRETVRYSGSPLKYSFSEELQKKAVPVVTFLEKGSVDIVNHPVSFLHDMRTIRGKIEQLLSKEAVSGADPNDYIRAVITDEEEVIDPIGKLRVSYPNIMELLVERNRDQENGTLTLPVSREKSPQELFDSFMELTIGEVEEKRAAYVNELLKEGDEYEATDA